MRRSALIAFLLLSSPLALFGQKLTYEIRFHGAIAGKDTFTIKKSKQGYDVSTQYSYAIGSSEGHFANEYRLDDAYQWLQASSNNQTLAIRYVDTVDKTRTRLHISITQNGAGSNSELPVRPDLELLPSLDPAAAQILLLRATTHPTQNGKYNIVAPSFGEPEAMASLNSVRDGVSPAALATMQLPSSRESYDAAWQKGADVSGTLNGKPVAAHVYLLIFGSFRWVFLADDDSTLLQMNVLPRQPVFVKQGFALNPQAVEALSANP
ncbi:hypothetical protein SAMN05421770_11014 [Granulicella rosea]|uniref:DUF3108 domain-containing protein n=1 Tax=Granulicella rosea TaxID=474952 RepID=A0A239M753_9BACT|nr:hypothetical protein [Granulicella rosea]SNT37874.1 hypothetical protein SAMN05421770_11014 [Granulicella rosea]